MYQESRGRRPSTTTPTASKSRAGPCSRRKMAKRPPKPTPGATPTTPATAPCPPPTSARAEPQRSPTTICSASPAKPWRGCTPRAIPIATSPPPARRRRSPANPTPASAPAGPTVARVTRMTRWGILQRSRYYDPAIGRFINADGQISLDGSFLNTNQFAYCGNNPVNQVDPEGNSFKSVLSLVTNYQIAKKIHNLYFKLFNRRRNACERSL